ncbi:MAG: DUF86 domain-containing protein [Proteobacteria bacterium]|nr:DUF86 domain-containing protein [Pseudomonadota bacterium]MBU1715455.1 DUF86 domain-containing protein [Pseudomonadota bacterium]
MSPEREWRFRIEDILNSIRAIQEYTEGQTYEEFTIDRKTVDAVIRNFIIIGEAATHVPDRIVNDNQIIPWAEMRAMRNFVVHEYFGVSDTILWDTAKQDLTPVPDLLRQLLDKKYACTEK